MINFFIINKKKILHALETKKRVSGDYFEFDFDKSPHEHQTIRLIAPKAKKCFTFHCRVELGMIKLKEGHKI